MSSKEELRRLIEDMDDRSVDDVADYVRWLRQDSDTLRPDEWQRVQHGERELAQGKRVTLKEWRREHDV